MPSSLSALDAVPFAPNTSSLSQLLMQQGQNRANAALQSGNIWSNALQNVGQAVSQGVQDYQQVKNDRAKQAMMAQKLQQDQEEKQFQHEKDQQAMTLAAESARRDADADREKLRSDRLAFEDKKADFLAAQADRIAPFMNGPDGGVGAFQEALQHSAEFLGEDAVKQYGQITPEQIPQVLDSIRQASPKWRAQQEAKARETAAATQQKFENDQKLATAAEIKRHNTSTEAQARAAAQAAAAKGPNLERVDTVDAEGRPVTQFLAPTAGQTFVKPPAKANDETLSGSDAKILAIADTLPGEIGKIKKAFDENYRGAVGGYVTGVNRDLVKVIDQVADKVGRLRSGGAINKDEEARFLSQIASAKDYVFGNKAGASEALDSLIDEANRVSSGIRGGKKAPSPAGGKGNPLGLDL